MGKLRYIVRARVVAFSKQGVRYFNCRGVAFSQKEVLDSTCKECGILQTRSILFYAQGACHSPDRKYFSLRVRDVTSFKRNILFYMQGACHSPDRKYFSLRVRGVTLSKQEVLDSTCKGSAIFQTGNIVFKHKGVPFSRQEILNRLRFQNMRFVLYMLYYYLS